jgi:hemoglobin-like flavoprotein/ferredoxin-NADP reductase
MSRTLFVYRGGLLSRFRRQSSRSLQTYKFGISQKDLDTVKATLPLVAEAGTDFTKHFYTRMFQGTPDLLNVFNQTNQALPSEGQPKKLLKTVAVAAQAAIETGELPGEAIEGICQKHAALNVAKEHYAVVGEHILGTIQDLLTDDKDVLSAWEALYGDIASVFIAREQEICKEMAQTPGGWLGRREFRLAKKEKLGETISRFQFVPCDGEPTPLFKPGKFTTVWVNVSDMTAKACPYANYQEQPRHYTLALPRNPEDAEKSLSISVKKQGLVSGILHDAAIDSTFDLSAPYGCFDLSGVEKLWLSEGDDDAAAPVVFLSAGVGITPVLAMLENIYVTRPASWLHASENGAVHAYRDRLREIAACRCGELIRRVWYSHPVPEDGPPGGNEQSEQMLNLAKYHYKGRMDLAAVVDEFPDKVLHLEDDSAQYYICGPPGFMDAQRKGLVSLGVDENQIHCEGF